MRIIDDFLDHDDFKNIQKLLLGAEFPWFYNSGINYLEDTPQTPNPYSLMDFQFVHTFYVSKGGYETVHSGFFDSLLPILNKLPIKVLYRIKANLLTPTDETRVSGFHIDPPDATYKLTTAIFYLNTNNGYTQFKDREKKVESIANRMVTFPSQLLHSGTSCTDQKTRVVINLNYLS